MRRFIGSVSLVASTLIFAAPTLGQEAANDETSPPGNPPQILIASSIDPDGNLALVNYRTIYIGFTGESYNHRSVTTVTLTDVRISTVKGNELSVEATRNRISGRDTPILVSSWKQPLPRFYERMFTPETLHFVFPKDAPVWKSIQDPSQPVK